MAAPINPATMIGRRFGAKARAAAEMAEISWKPCRLTTCCRSKEKDHGNDPRCRRATVPGAALI